MLLLYFQALLLLCSFVVGFLISIPIGLNKSSYNGSCLLYAHIDEHGNKVSDDQHKTDFYPGSAMTCNFCIFSGSVCLLLALLLLCGTLFFIARNFNLKIKMKLMDRGWRSYRKSTASKPLIGAWVHFCVSCGMMLLLFITSCFISFGFHSFCENGVGKILHDVKRCDHLEQFVGPFYRHLYLAQVSSWLGLVLWVSLAVIGWVRVRNLNNVKDKSFSPPSEEEDEGNYELMNRPEWL